RVRGPFTIRKRPHQGLGHELIAPQAKVIGPGSLRSAVSGSAACSSSTTARPHSPDRVFAHDALAPADPLLAALRQRLAGLRWMVDGTAPAADAPTAQAAATAVANALNVARVRPAARAAAH